MKMRNQCIVGNCVLRNYSFLKKLAKTTSEKKRRELIRNASPAELGSIVEIAYNIVKSQFKLTPAKKQKLLPYATPIRQLSNARTANTAKRVLQDGNGFPLASLLLPVLLAVGETLLK